MKILKIYIQNLNSLKGEFTIDFEVPPLKNSGLFLISGKTGAGKTTILDAITLALYGDAPRFDDVKGKQASEMMTHGCSESAAELTFSTQSGTFIAKWRMRRTRTGNLEKTARRELCQILPDGEMPIIATKITEVDTEIEKILGGLNFNRFKRSIMLAQGDFAQFLRGTEDRSDILERITDTALYSEISKHAHLRYRQEEKKLEQFTQQLSHSQLLDEEKVSTLKTEKTEKEQQSTTLRQNIDQYNNALQWHEQNLALLKEKESSTNRLKLLEEEKESLQEDFLKLELHLLAADFLPDLRSMDKQQLSLNNLLEEIAQLEKQQVDIEHQLALKSEELSAKQQVSLATEHEILEQEPIWDKVRSLDMDIETHQSSFAQIKAEWQNVDKNVKEKEASIATVQLKIAALEPEITEISDWLAANSIDPRMLDNSIFVSLSSFSKEQELLEKASTSAALELKSIKKRYQNKEKALAETIAQNTTQEKAAAKALKEMSAQIAHFDKSLVDASLDDILFELSSQLDDLSEQLLALRELEKILSNREEILDKLEQISENKLAIETALENIDYYSLQLYEQKVLLEEEIDYQNSLCETLQNSISLEEHRLLLKADCPCPLCGAEEHPYVNAGMNKDLFDSKFAKEKHKLSRLQAAKKEKEEEFWKQQNYANEIDKSKKLLEKESDQLQAVWLEMETSAIKLFRDYPQLPEAAIEYAEAELQAEIENTNAKFINFNAIKSTLEKGNTDLNLLKEKQLANAQIMTVLEKDLAQSNTELAKQKSIVEEIEKDQHELLKKLNKELSNIHPALKQTSELSAVIKKLEQVKKTYTKQQELLAERKKDKNEFEANLHTQKSLLEQVKTQAKGLEEKLRLEHQVLKTLKADRTALFGEKDTNEERQKLKTLFNSLKTALETLELSKNQLNADKQATDNLLADKKKTQLRLREEYDLQWTELTTKASKNGFEDLKALRNAILAETIVQSISEKKLTLEKNIEKQAADLDVLTQKLLLLNDSAPEELNITSLTEAKKEAEAEWKSILQEIGKISQILEEQANLKRAQKTLVDKIQAQKTELQRWRSLYELIGHAEGKKFRQFAQNITLNKLIHLANKHLRQFVSGRYLLEKRAEDSLEIDIIDTFQANNKRPLNTLSGGETFLASLSLALGLSDLAGGRAQIESLFIDEGFGTLDQDTLQVALRALQILQSQGKTIGIISHVPQLQEKIEVQIKVQKKSAGNSVIEY